MYADTTAWLAAYPVATSKGVTALVGSTAPYAEYVCNGSAWLALTLWNTDGTLRTPAGGSVAVGGTSGGLPAYLGQVATRSYYPNVKQASYTQAMIRSSHFARDDIAQLQLVWQDRYGTLETASGAPTTVECAVEYPSGTYTRVKFAGADQGVMASGGTLTSDFCTVTIPDGARFWLRTYRLNASGLIHTDFIGMNANAPAGEATDAGASVVNKVMGGTITGAWYPSTPIAILSMITKPSVFIYGDSRALGISDNWNTNPSGNGGEIARSIGENFGYVLCGAVGAQLVQAGSGVRTNLVQYCSHSIVEFGINDIQAYGKSLATLQPFYTALWTALSAGGTKPVFQTTMPPLGGTTTDAWATVANQTPHATDGVRIATNAWIRSQGDGPLDGYLEVADAIESGRDTGKWKAPGYTTDGGHENKTGCYAIFASGAISPSFFIRR